MSYCGLPDHSTCFRVAPRTRHARGHIHSNECARSTRPAIRLPAGSATAKGTFMINQRQSPLDTSRRRVLLRGTTALSATAVALLAGAPAWAAGKAAGHNPSHDAAVLSTAIALEHEAINAYTLSAQSNLLESPFSPSQ